MVSSDMSDVVECESRQGITATPPCQWAVTLLLRRETPMRKLRRLYHRKAKYLLLRRYYINIEVYTLIDEIQPTEY